MEKYRVLIVVDVQNDFVTGSLRNEEAIKKIPNILKKMQSYYEDKNTKILYTKDTHDEDYLNTSEGQKLPIEHCIKYTDGWNLVPEVKELIDAWKKVGKETFSVMKPTFGSIYLPRRLEYIFDNIATVEENVKSIELIGFCTDICVISNALLLKAHFPEIPIIVDASCCAGVTPLTHQAALTVMKSCQIDIINE